MKKHRQNNSQGNYLPKKSIPKLIILSFKAIRVTLNNWIEDPFT